MSIGVKPMRTLDTDPYGDYFTPVARGIFRLHTLAYVSLLGDFRPVAKDKIGLIGCHCCIGRGRDTDETVATWPA